MKDKSPFELMESAWAARRASLELPDAERREIMDGVRSDLELAAELFRRESQQVPFAHALHLRAHVELDIGEEELAGELWTSAVAVLRSSDDPLQLAHKLRHLGDLESRMGRLDQASEHLGEALALYRTLDDSDELDVANAVNRMALHKERLGESDEARALWAEAKERYATMGLEAGVQEAEQHLAELR